MTNCPNCGAPIDPFRIKCDYCGSFYFDFCAFDCDTEKPVYVKFKTRMDGREIALTALAKPSLEQVEVNSDVAYCTDRIGNTLRSVVVNKTCEINAKFRCIPNRGKSNTLFTIEVSE